MVIIILPAYNEEKNIRSLLESINDSMKDSLLDYEVVVVNDGSSDNTAQIVSSIKNIPIDLVNHEKNKGLGEAIKTGFLRGLEIAREKDILVTMDADNTHIPWLILRMVRLIREGNEVVIASRYQRGARVQGVPFSRLVLSKIASIMFQILFPFKGVKDYTSGYRAYRYSVLKRAFQIYGDDFINEPGFACMVDILLKIRKLDVIACEVPMILRYDQKGGKTKMNIAKTIKETLRLVFARIGR